MRDKDRQSETLTQRHSQALGRQEQNTDTDKQTHRQLVTHTDTQTQTHTSTATATNIGTDQRPNITDIQTQKQAQK